MSAFIHKLRAKSPETKQRILLLISIMSFVLLVGLWIVVLGMRARASDEKIALMEKKGESPFSIVIDSISNSFHNLQQK